MWVPFSSAYSAHSVKSVVDIRKKFVTMKVVGHWNREAGDAPEPLNVFRVRLDGILSDLV